MIIGVPKEIKTNENRVALVPAGAEALVGAGPHGAASSRAPGSAAGSPTRPTSRPARRSCATADEVWASGRDDHEGEGADRGGVAADAARAR